MSAGVMPIGADTYEHEALRGSVRTFLARHVVPEYANWDAIPRELLRRAAHDGFSGIHVPESFGGPGVGDPRLSAIVAEEAMRVGAPALALALIGHDEAVVPALVRPGSGYQQSHLLPRLATADVLATVVHGDVTVAVDGERATVDGSACFVVQGVDAELLVVIGSDPARAVLVPRSADGLTIEPSPPSIGLRAAGLADVRFEGVTGQPLGEDGTAARELIADLELGLAVTAVAGARAALAITADYVQDRKAFGQPIASFQNTRQALATAGSGLLAAEAFVAACLQERLAGPLAPARAAALKLNCAELYGTVVDAGVQLHGGYGYIMEYPIAHAYADARFWRLYGAPTAAAMDLIAESILI